MLRRIVLILVCIAIFPLFSGCWSRNEVETLAIVTGMGIDKVKTAGKDRFELTLSMIRPSLAGGGTEGGRGKGQPVYWRVTSVGDTLADAERKINLRVPRKVFYGHLRFVVLSGKVAKMGLADVIDYLHRNRSIRPGVLLLLTEKKATDIFISYSELESSLSREVEEIEGMSGVQVSKVRILDLSETTDELVSPGFDPVIAKVTPIQSKPTEPGGKPITVLNYFGGGVLKVDKLVGWLDDKETRGYLLARGLTQQSAFALKLYKHPTDDVTINMTRASTKIKVFPKGDKIEASIRVMAEGYLSEYHKTNAIATKAGMKTLEKSFAKAIEHDLRAAVKKAQSLDADIFGFGNTLRSVDQAKWKLLEKKWYDIFPHIEVKVVVEAHVRRTGMIGNPFVPK